MIVLRSTARSNPNHINQNQVKLLATETLQQPVSLFTLFGRHYWLLSSILDQFCDLCNLIENAIATCQTGMLTLLAF